MTTLSDMPLIRLKVTVNERISHVLEASLVLLAPVAAIFVFRLSIINQEGYLDPWLYTGLARNLNLMWSAIGLNYYVVRFSVILPMRFGFLMFGDIGGYIAVHFFAYVVLVVPLYLAVRCEFGQWVAIATLVFTISTPIVARFILWDYVNFLAAPYFVASISCCYLGENRNPIYWLLSGVFAAAAVVANAFLLAGVGLFFLSDLLVVIFIERKAIAGTLIDRLWVIVGALVCAAAGWLGYIVVLGWIPAWNLIKITLQTVRLMVSHADEHSMPLREWATTNYDAYIPIFLAVAVSIGFARNRIGSFALRPAVFACVYISFYVVWEFAGAGFVVEEFVYFAYLFPAIVLLVTVVLSCSKDSPLFAVAFSVALVTTTVMFAWSPATMQTWLGAITNSPVTLCVYLIVSLAVTLRAMIPPSRPWFELLGAAGFALVLQVGVLANPTYRSLYNPAVNLNQIPTYQLAAEMVRITREYSEPGQWIMTWVPGRAEFTQGAAWANFATLLTSSRGDGLLEITSHELNRLADKRFGQILIVSSDPTKIDEGLNALQANGVRVVERERVVLVNQPTKTYASRVEILSRPVATAN